MQTIIFDSVRQMRLGFFQRRASLDTAQKITLTLVYACLTGMLAQFVFFLPGDPVPVTGQTFAVLLGALLLGRWGGMAQAAYTALGVAGIPWFAAGKSGVAAIIGPTGGYMFGFVIAAFFLGLWAEKHFTSSSPAKALAAVFFANFIVVYGFGLVQLGYWSLMAGQTLSFAGLVGVGALPFFAGDALKAVLAVALARWLSRVK